MRHVRGLIEAARQSHAGWELALDAIELRVDLVPHRLDGGPRPLRGRHEHGPPAVEAGSIGRITVAPRDLCHIAHAHEPAVPPSDHACAHLPQWLLAARGAHARALWSGTGVS